MYDRNNLGFQYRELPYYVKSVYTDGVWSSPKLVSGGEISLSIASVCFHYGQALFEGMKAYRHRDGRIALFRPEKNAERMQASARRTCMQAPDTELFISAVQLAIQHNSEHMPPYGSGASMYIRPLLLGTSAQIGVAPSEEYTFLVMVMPVGPYYSSGLSVIKAMMIYDYSRACPGGTGAYKVAGNYAGSLLPSKTAKKNGYQVELYLDSKEHNYIDECGTANFFAIQGNTYITPNSASILPSITNDSLMQIAKSSGMDIEKRPIHKQELGDFQEVGACGTAAVITPISEIYDSQNNKTYKYGSSRSYIEKLYHTLTGIQYGEQEDIYNWLYILKE